MDVRQKIQCSIPENLLLRKQLAYYYFLEENKLTAPLAFRYYPHYYSTLNFYRHAALEIKNHTRYIHSNDKAPIQAIYSNNIDTTKESIVNEALDVIGIVFQPLGFNHFFPEQRQSNRQEYLLDFSNVVWQDDLERIFAAKSIQDKTQLLDTLLIKNCTPAPVALLQQVIYVILECHGDIELLELADQFQVNRRTILRHFKQHLGCSFSSFRAVVKFRFALKEGVRGKHNLSALAYEYNYYDQSDFTKQFKAKTSETPKKLINTLTQVTDQLFWKLDSSV